MPIGNCDGFGLLLFLLVFIRAYRTRRFKIRVNRFIATYLLKDINITIKDFSAGDYAKVFLTRNIVN